MKSSEDLVDQALDWLFAHRVEAFVGSYIAVLAAITIKAIL